MTIAALSHQIHLSLEDPTDVTRREQVLTAVDEFVALHGSSDEPEALLLQLQDELQTIHKDIDHTQLGHTQVFLDVLYRLNPILSSTSIISTWFDLALRPALRESKLPTVSVNHAKELIVSAARNVDGQNPEKTPGFQRRLLELYLLDGSVDNSDDLLEWAALDQKNKDKRSVWKSNLEDVLVKFGLQCPQVGSSCMNGPGSEFNIWQSGIYGGSRYCLCNAFISSSATNFVEYLHVGRSIPAIGFKTSESPTHGRFIELVIDRQFVDALHHRSHSACQTSSYICGLCLGGTQEDASSSLRYPRQGYMLEGAPPSSRAFF